jgi:phosphoglycerol transferase MdoB-like AlkP superfamily enzyme
VILGDRSNLVRLDAQLAHPERRDEMYKFDICSTLTELGERLDHDRGRQTPVFFFSQPQSLHIRVLSADEYPQYDVVHSGASIFFKPAVAALRRIDTCFGEFIAGLKARQMYDDSIVILTSDHGDFHGEGGRWGHAFYLSPETSRIPLIMHIPPKLREQRRWDSEAIAMLTDVTPTLYELLGYRPVADNEILGRTLLRTDAEPDSPARDMYLLQSSYSRIFGLLEGHGQWLYTASANQLKEEFFDLRGDQPKTRSLTPAERLQYRKWLLDRIGVVNSYYRPN